MCVVARRWAPARPAVSSLHPLCADETISTPQFKPRARSQRAPACPRRARQMQHGVARETSAAAQDLHAQPQSPGRIPRESLIWFTIMRTCALHKVSLPLMTTANPDLAQPSSAGKAEITHSYDRTALAFIVAYAIDLRSDAKISLIATQPRPKPRSGAGKSTVDRGRNAH